MRPAILLGLWRAILHFGFNAAVIALALPLRWRWSFAPPAGPRGGELWLFVAPLTLAVFAALVALSCGRALRAVIRENRFGIISAHRESDTGEEQFTDWLGRQIQELSGLPRETPLTFGHLADAPRRGEPHSQRQCRSSILELIGTNVTHGIRVPQPVSRMTKPSITIRAECEHAVRARMSSARLDRRPKAGAPPAVRQRGDAPCGRSPTRRTFRSWSERD